MLGQKYGLTLAERVAEYLVSKKDYIGYTHRDYCGTGFTLYEGISIRIFMMATAL